MLSSAKPILQQARVHQANARTVRAMATTPKTISFATGNKKKLEEVRLHDCAMHASQQPTYMLLFFGPIPRL
jgi:hypothetical protein